MRKIRLSIVGIFVLLLISRGIASQAQDDGYSLTILHTNDAHAHYIVDEDEEGGAARQATIVKEIREETNHVLLVDGGDRFTGSNLHSYHQGQDSAQVMVELGYDAMVLGSYEFTHGAEVLADFVDALDFPVVVSNVNFSKSPSLEGKIQPYVLIEVDGETIGITGVTQGDARLRPIAELEFRTDYVDAVQVQIDIMRDEGVNKIIVISHLGYFSDLEMGTLLDGADVIVGGDSNTLLSNTDEDAEGPYPAVTESLTGEPVLIVQAGLYNEYMGRLDVEFDSEGVLQNWSGDTIFLDPEIAQDPDMLALLDELEAPIDTFLSEVVGVADVYLDGSEESCRFEECAMGNLITDALRYTTGAQIAFQNGGGIRASIETGDITVGNVQSVLPFNNTYVIFELSGEDIIAALENGVSRVDSDEGNGRFLQVSGLRYSYDSGQEVGRRIVNVEVLADDGQWDILDPGEVYTIATNDYLYAGGDNYTMFSENSDNGYDYGVVLEKAVRDYISATSPINVSTEGRIIQLDR